MNNNTEKDYWPRAVREVLNCSGETIEQLAVRMGVTSRQVFNWMDGQRPTGLVAIKLYAYRQSLALQHPKYFPN